MPRCTRALPILLLAVTSCYTSDVGLLGNDRVTTIEITDAPFPYEAVARVDLYVVAIAVRSTPDTTAGTGWTTIAEPRHRFNLMALSAGVTDTLGRARLAAGEFHAVRMIIDTDSSAVTAQDGGAIPVTWPSAGPLAMNAMLEPAISVPDAGTQIVIDFDVGRSFLCTTSCASLTFNAVFRAVNRSATGSVSGAVIGDSTEVFPSFISNVTVTAYQGDPALADSTWTVAATGRTNARGFFRIAYLLPGTYILRAEAPRSSPFTAGTRSDVVVTAGVEVPNQRITLPGIH